MSRLLTAAVIGAMMVASVLRDGPSEAAEPTPESYVISSGAMPRDLKIAVSKSVVIDYNEEIRDILVSNPAVADAVVRSNRRLYLLANKFGTTNIIVFNAAGRQIANFQVQVQPDTATLESLLRKLLPDGQISVEAVAGTVVLNGSVRTAADATRAQDVASRFVGAPVATAGAAGDTGGAAAGTGASGDTLQIVNALAIRGKEQVMLKVVIAEMQRTAVKALGIDLTSAKVGGVSFNTLNGFALLGSQPTALSASGRVDLGGTSGVNSTFRTLERNGLIRTLSEPNLSAISGEEANFLVGGELPIPVAADDNRITYEFKKYGVSLGFVPVVLSEGRISLKVNTEVSEPTTEGALTVGNVTVRGLRVRRASTTVELPSGGTMVMAGLIQDDARQSFEGTPGLMKLPVLGALFRSRDFLRSQTELAIFVQPVVVEPVAPNKLVRPDQNFQVSSDAAAIFLGRVNRMYRTEGSKPPAGGYQGQYGFIYQ